MDQERELTLATNEPVSRGHLRQQVGAKILAAVFQGRFRSGQRLVVQQLTELYAVSPTPVRESLLELASLGIVELLPTRGAVVRPFGPQELREICQIRRVLEVEAARCACGRIAAEDLASVERELTRLQAMSSGRPWIPDARAVDTRLHALISSSCGSRRLTSEIERYVMLWRTLRDASQRRDAEANIVNATRVLAEHLAIVRALLKSDPEEASRAMDLHIRDATQILEEILSQRPAVAEAQVAGRP